MEEPQHKRRKVIVLRKTILWDFHSSRHVLYIISYRLIFFLQIYCLWLGNCDSQRHKMQFFASRWVNDCGTKQTNLHIMSFNGFCVVTRPDLLSPWVREVLLICPLPLLWISAVPSHLPRFSSFPLSLDGCPCFSRFAYCMFHNDHFWMMDRKAQRATLYCLTI